MKTLLLSSIMDYLLEKLLKKINSIWISKRSKRVEKNRKKKKKRRKKK